MHTIRGHVQLGEKVVSQHLGDICTIKFQGHEHDTGPSHYTKVDLVDQCMFFAPCPSCKWIESMKVFPCIGQTCTYLNICMSRDLPIVSGLVFLCRVWVVKDARLHGPLSCCCKRRCVLVSSHLSCNGIGIIDPSALPPEPFLLEWLSQSGYLIETCRRSQCLRLGGDLNFRG